MRRNTTENALYTDNEFFSGSTHSFFNKELLEREMNNYRRLGCAVVLQWLEDYYNALKEEKEKRQGILQKNKLNNKNKREDLNTLYRWPWTEWAKFWCEVAGLNLKKIQDLAMEMKNSLYEKNTFEKIKNKYTSIKYTLQKIVEQGSLEQKSQNNSQNNEKQTLKSYLQEDYLQEDFNPLTI